MRARARLGRWPRVRPGPAAARGHPTGGMAAGARQLLSRYPLIPLQTITIYTVIPCRLKRCREFLQQPDLAKRRTALTSTDGYVKIGVLKFQLLRIFFSFLEGGGSDHCFAHARKQKERRSTVLQLPSFGHFYAAVSYRRLRR